MSKTKVLYISHSILPYLPATELSTVSRYLPQAMQDKGKEIRLFMPRFGCINERRHQLHEVIRLSGMNLVIDDHDHPLIIKVATIPQAKMQVYFIDNEEYFKRKSVLCDPDAGTSHPDNDERMLFFGKGVIETVKKLGWAPDIIHCQGWLSSMVPLLLRSVYKDEPLFADSKIVYSIYPNEPYESVAPRLHKKLQFEPIDNPEMYSVLANPTFDNIHLNAAVHADGVILGSSNLNLALIDSIEKSGTPMLPFLGEDYIEGFHEFYNSILQSEDVLVD